MSRRNLLLAITTSPPPTTELQFPVYLVEGDNGQLGIDVYNYFITKYTEGNRGIEIEESLFVNISGVNEQLTLIYDIMSSSNTILFGCSTFGIFYVLYNTGYVEMLRSGAD